MKIISLNTWGGRAGKEKLLAFLAAHRDADVICLQEVWSAPYEELEGVNAGGHPINHDDIMVYGKQEIKTLLSDHVSYFRPQHKDDYGLLLLVHKKHQVLSEGEVFVYRDKGYVPERAEDIGTHARNVQYVTIARESEPLTVMNFHGLWNGKGKGDSLERLQQSDKIIAFLQTIATPIVFCGDFNLTPGTESIKKIEQYGVRNLITEYGVTSTRTSYYTKPEKYADYVFVSSDVAVNNFQVLPEEVSDHAPLLLQIH